jgi:protein-disulfide isomerase
MTSRQRIYVLGGVLGVALIAVVLAIALGGGSKKAAPPSPVLSHESSSFLAGVPQHGDTLGRPDAPATVYVFEDPQCPYCRDWSVGTLPSVVGTFVKTGRAKLVWRGIPIVGRNSLDGLTSAYAAGNQNKLWNLVDQLYKRQGAENSGWITDATLRDAAASAGVNADRMLADAKTEPVAEKVTAAENAANTAQVQGTPSFVVNGNLLPLSSLDPTEFNTALSAALAQ